MLTFVKMLKVSSMIDIVKSSMCEHSIFICIIVLAILSVISTIVSFTIFPVSSVDYEIISSVILLLVIKCSAILEKLRYFFLF